jgi:serine/threonine-protein kinase
MPFAIGENVGPYRITEQLGQGGMATVYKAYHPALDRYVAIKALHPAFLEDPNFLARFHREAKVVAKLEHPNIVPIYDFAEHKGQPYLVMKFIEGETLKARLERRTLTIEEAKEVARAIGGALSFAHKQGILHRDIKPSNIILTPGGTIYLADFGLARIAQSGESTLSADMMLGTPHYISPEQARGEKELDEGTDIYSFGVVLYQIVVGRVPFNADTPFSIIHDHIYTPLPLPRALNPRVPDGMQTVLLKALDKPRENRFATVDDLVEAFCAAADRSDLSSLPAVSTVRLPAMTRPGRAREEAAPTVGGPPAVPLPPTTPARAPAPAGAAPEPKKRSRAWIWVVGGLALTCLCLLAFAWATNRRNAGPAGTGVASQDLYLDERGQPAAVPDARRAVESQPDDPQARLNLAAAYHAAGMDRLAIDELVKAGRMFVASGAYVDAIRAFADAATLRGGLEAGDPAVVDSFQQAVFFGAPDRGTWDAVNRLLDVYPPWDPLLAAASRTRLFQDRHDEARAMAQDVLSRNPVDPVAMASLLEIYITTGDAAAADTARRASDLPAVPDWLRLRLTELIQAAGR